MCCTRVNDRRFISNGENALYFLQSTENLWQTILIFCLCNSCRATGCGCSGYFLISLDHAVECRRDNCTRCCRSAAFHGYLLCFSPSARSTHYYRPQEVLSQGCGGGEGGSRESVGHQCGGEAPRGACPARPARPARTPAQGLLIHVIDYPLTPPQSS